MRRSRALTRCVRYAGGKVLGYQNVDVLVDGKRRHVRREVDPAQADIVRHIFQLCADGKGLKRIVKALNDAGVVNPTGRPLTGAPSLSRYLARCGLLPG